MPKRGYVVVMLSVGKILIVDDEPMVTKTLKMLLGLEGYKDIYAFNAPLDALEFLKSESVDLIVSDFIMPKMNGLEFLSAAKELHPNCTQILLTGYADKENAIKAINELGIFKYIEKPWQNNDLVINIKNGIERTKLKVQLENKIRELEEANKKLEEHSTVLEETVRRRTSDLTVANLKMSAIIDNCADGIVIFDKNYSLMQANKASEELFGLCENELRGKNFFEIVISEKDKKAAGILRNDEPFYLRDFYLLNYKKEQKVPVEVNVAPVFDENNEFYVAVVRDVSYQKENERLRDDFIATLTHDLRTPLLAAISGLEFMLNKSLGDVTEKQEVFLSTMKQSNEDMLGLVNALLEVYRYESGRLHLCKTQFCLNGLVGQCIKEIEPLVKEKDLKLLFDGNNEFIINADRNEIRRVVLNLVGNAIKHSEDASSIEIKTVQEERDVKLSVKDYGSGLSAQDIDKLFKRFSQGTSRKRACSTGLGLYLSRQIVEAHNGKIWAESELDSGGKGSEFFFLLKNAVTENRVLI